VSSNTKFKVVRKVKISSIWYDGYVNGGSVNVEKIKTNWTS